MKTIDMREWLRQLEPELRGVAGGGVHLVLTLPDAPAFVTCDVAQLQQVVNNLLVNARDAMGASGEISLVLTADPTRETLELVVSDSGPGIPARALDHLFEPLFTTKRVGSGLGLAVARQVVTQHGGTIEATNAAGGGAQFRLTLPSVDAAAQRTAQAAPSKQLNVQKVLVVEDEELVAVGLTMLLEDEGFSVCVANRGGIVMELAHAFVPDVVVLDVTLPDVDGAAVFRMLRERWPLLPVVFSTGHGSRRELAWALESGHVELLQKPYDIDTLLEALARVASAVEPSVERREAHMPESPAAM